MSLTRRRFGITGLPKDYHSHGLQTPETLRNAIRSGDLAQVESILKEKPELIQSKDRQNRATPLHGASSLGYTEMIQYLVENGAAIDARDRRGCTPLVSAAAWGHKAAVEMLLAHKASIDLADDLGRTPLHWALRLGRGDVAELLCARGADQNAKTHLGVSQLMCAAAGGCLPILERLLTSGADPDERNNHGATPLMGAAAEGRVEAAQLLLTHGANANAKENSGLDALQYAAYRGHLDFAKLLLSHGADVNSRSNEGWTALHAAACGGHLDVVEWLLENGAEVNATNSRHETPLFWAAVGYSGAGAEKPKEMDEGAGERAEAAKEVSPKSPDKAGVVRCLLSRGADANESDERGLTPLYYAAYAGDLEVANLLLAGGADVNAKSKDGWTALCAAAKKGYAGIVKLLLDHGADAGIKVEGIYTPFNCAILNGSKEIAELLLPTGTADRPVRWRRCPACNSDKQALIGDPLFVSDRQKRKILRCTACGAIWSPKEFERRGWLISAAYTVVAVFFAVEVYRDPHRDPFGRIGLAALWITMGISSLSRYRQAPRIWVQGQREGFACPACGAAPHTGKRWKCMQCGKRFDTFLSRAVCPHCGARYSTTKCRTCKAAYPMNDWISAYASRNHGPVSG